MDLFTYLMAKNDHNTSVKKDLFSYLLGKGQSGTYTDYSGTSLSINNTKKAKMKVNLLGNTSQTGTPTPDNPIPVNVVSGDNEVVVSNSDGTQSQTYPINLPVENLASLETTGSVIGGVTFTKENGVIKINGTTTGMANFYFNNFQTKSGSAVFWIEVTGYTDKTSGNASLILQVSDNGSSGWTALGECGFKSTATHQQNVTLDSSKYYRIRWYTTDNTFTNATIKVQLEYGNKKNSFTPYGTTPIELNKISTYKDRFIINSGKNLFDESQLLEATGWTKSSGVYSGTVDNWFSKFRYGFTGLTFEENNQYTISLNGYTTGGTPRLKIVYTDSSSEYLVISGTSMTSYTKTTSSSKSVSSIQADFGTGSSNTLYLNSFIIAKGTSATYEPYGNGDWYLKKEIGKVVLDGSEDENYTYQSGNNGFTLNNYETPFSNRNLNVYDGYCNYLSVQKNSTTWTQVNYCGWNTTNVFWFIDNGAIATSVEDLRTWLSTHNIIVDYVLATPTYTKITYQPLIDQLNAVYRANSYKGQTNISQVNNDLPFNLDVEVKVSA